MKINYSISKYYQTIAFIICLGWILCPKVCHSQNIALHRPYRLSVKPNYALTAMPSDTSILTDGIYTKGSFWTSRTTVGWNKIPEVSVTIDLGKIQPVGSITFNTAKNAHAGVYFPESIYVFLSADGSNFRYAGDAASPNDENPDKYEVRKLFLNNINQPARYILLRIIPRGTNIFCDEIEVIKGKSGSILSGRLIPKNSINGVVDSLKGIDYTRESISLAIKFSEAHRVGQYNLNTDSLSRINKQLNDLNVTPTTLIKIKKELGRLNASKLYLEYKKPFIIERINPWSSSESINDVYRNSDKPDYNFLISKGNVQYGAFVITNLLMHTQHLYVHISNDGNVASLELFKVPYVSTERYVQVSDPLIGIKSDSISIRSGIPQLFIFKITGMQLGKSKSSITIASTSQLVILPIGLQIIGLPIDSFNLNSVNWAYLDYPMIRDRNKQACIDLYAHHINTIVVPSQFIPRLGNSDFAKLIHYLSCFKQVNNVLLSVGHKNSYSISVDYKKNGYLSDQWKVNFKNWYENMLAAIRRAGINVNVYLYPYDEVSGYTDINNFKYLAEWAKSSVSGFKIYGTLASKAAVINMSPFLDISQLLGFDLIQYLPEKHGEIWTYSIRDSARTLSPYTYYRLMAWKAFINDMTGIGFWNYTGGGISDSINEKGKVNVPAPFGNYSVIYDGAKGQIVSSRRWEAFALGIQDYSILMLYAKRFGKKEAKSLAERVIAQTDDINRADSVQSIMMQRLK